MVLPSQEIVSTHVCYSNKGICALLTQLSGRYIEKTMCTLPRDCTYSAAKPPSWSESILIILSVYTGDPVVDSREDSQNNSGELLEVQLMDYRSLKEKKNSLVPDIYRLTSPLWVIFLLWLDAQNLMRVLPLVQVHFKAEAVSEWYLNSTWLHLQKLSHLRQIGTGYRILHW